MGRGKPELKAAAWATEANNTDSLDDSVACGICGELVDKEEEFLRVFCNKCDQCHVHMECGVEFLIARAHEKSNSVAVSKYKVKARKQPVQIFEQRMPCPNGIFTLETDKGKQWGSQACRGKHTVTGACPGFTTGAELIKPAKEPPAPLPQVMPAHAPKEKKKEAKQAGAAPLKRTPSSASSTSTTSHLSTASTKMRAATGAAAPGSGAGVRLLGTSHSSWTTVGGGGGGGSFKKQSVPGAAPPPDRLRLPPGFSRPAELSLCKHFLDGGSCYMYHCEYAHSEEELWQREKAWVARQEAKKKEAARQEAAAKAAAAARLEEQEVLAQLASIESLHDTAPPATYQRSATPASARPPSVAAAPAADLRLSDRSLALMRSFKRSICLNSLLEMGFPSTQAGAATDAAGGDLERAAQMLMDGQPCGAALPTDVMREAEELASVAMALGKSADAVEDHLVMTGGNWEVASEAMQALAGASSSSFGDSTAVPEDLASWAPSEPDTPSVHAPAAAPWATDASSSLSAPSPYSQSPRAAAALAATAMGGLPPAPAAARGVLSLADFSDGPGLDAGLHHLTGPAGVSAAGAAALPTLLGLDASVPDSNGFSDGYAAGLAAAAAMYSQHQQFAVQPPSKFDATSLGSASCFAAPVPAAHDASYWGAALPAQAAANGAGDEEELDELLNLLGVGA